MTTSPSPMQVPPSGGGSLSHAGPLTAEHLRALNDARIRSRKARRAATVAMISGSTMIFFAVITLLSALFGDLAALLMGIGLSITSYNEIRGGMMLRRLDADGAIRLLYNQIALGVLIVAYSAWSLYS